MMATRRRGEALETAIYQAVLAEVGEQGYAATTYEGIAARAGTSKPVLYRRWPTKAEMVLAAKVASGTDRFDLPDTGSLEGDLKSLLRTVRGFVTDTRRETMLGLMADLHASCAESLRTLLFTQEYEALRPLLERAVRRGELPCADLAARVVTLPFDLVRHELTISGTLPDEAIDGIVDDVVLPLFRSCSQAGTA